MLFAAVARGSLAQIFNLPFLSGVVVATGWGELAGRDDVIGRLAWCNLGLAARYCAAGRVSC